MHPLHSLTPLTGREAAEKRTVVIGTVELNARLAMILGIATPIGFLAAAISWPILSQYAIFVFPITLFGAAFLFYRRTTDGMNLHTYQALLDKKRSGDVGKVYLCGHEVDVESTHLVHLRHNTAPYRVDATQTAPVIASTPAAPPRARGRRAPVDGHAFHGGFETSDSVGTTDPAPAPSFTRDTAPAFATSGASRGGTATLTRATENFTENFTDTLSGLKGAGERVTGALRPRRHRIEEPNSSRADLVETPAAAPTQPVFEPTSTQPAFVAPPAPVFEPAPVPAAAPTQPAFVAPAAPVAPPAPVFEPAPVYVESRPEADAPRQAAYRPAQQPAQVAPAPAPDAVPVPAAPVAVSAPEPDALGFDGPAPSGDPATDFDAGVFFDQPTTRRKRGIR